VYIYVLFLIYIGRAQHRPGPGWAQNRPDRAQNQGSGTRDPSSIVGLVERLHTENKSEKSELVGPDSGQCFLSNNNPGPENIYLKTTLKLYQMFTFILDSERSRRDVSESINKNKMLIQSMGSFSMSGPRPGPDQIATVHPVYI